MGTSSVAAPTDRHLRLIRGLAPTVRIGVFFFFPNIDEVVAGSPAEGAGLRVGDIIREADGREVRRFTDYMKILHTKEPGDTITVHVDRDGVPITMTVPVVVMGVA